MQFTIDRDFKLNGDPIKVISGSVHYFRIAPSKWHQSLFNLKAMGANTVETYIPWNFHEPKQGQFRFSGRYDVEAFIKEAAALDLMVILRPCPYICAEWEFGGFPAWLLTQPGRIRTQDPAFMANVDRYFGALMPRLVPHQSTHGGNVIMMQVENEYGSYGDDQTYLRKMVALMKKHGVDVPLITADGGWHDALDAGSLIEEGVLPTANFGSDVATNFGALQRFMDAHGLVGPLMCTEFWDGWFNQWGKPVIRRDADSVVAETKAILDRGSINFYMFHGGTNFGFTNGANEALEEGYRPQVTSYDYDAILTEQGNPTEKFTKLQAFLHQAGYLDQLVEPITSHAKQYPTLEAARSTSLFGNLRNLASDHRHFEPQTMEQWGQNDGYVVYQLAQPVRGNRTSLQLIGTNDRASVWLNRRLVGVRERPDMESPIELAESPKGQQLTVMVENRGRTNFGAHLVAPTQYKGIAGGVFHSNHFISDWHQFGLDFEDISGLDYSQPVVPDTPNFTEFTLTIDGQPEETFLDMRGWGKGVVLVNGVNVGRFWSVGPYLSLFVPQDFLKQGANQITVFQEGGTPQPSLAFSEHPVLIDPEAAEATDD